MQRGFTLVELLVVLVIVGIAGSGIALALDRLHADDSEHEVERLRRALEGAAYRAELRGRALAVDFLPDGYRFSELQPDGGWLRLKAPPELAPRAFTSGLRLASLRIIERTSRQAMPAGSDSTASAGMTEGDGSRRIIFGTRPPGFELALAGEGASYRIRGSIDGRIKRLSGEETAQ